MVPQRCWQPPWAACPPTAPYMSKDTSDIFKSPLSCCCSCQTPFLNRHGLSRKVRIRNTRENIMGEMLTVTTPTAFSHLFCWQR